MEFAAEAVADVARAFDPAADDSQAAPFAFARDRAGLCEIG